MGVLQKNKAFFIFLIKFGVTYLVLSAIYWLYLSRYDASAFEPDGITRIVAEQSRSFINLVGQEAGLRQRRLEASFRLFVNSKSVVRVVEGCNAVSVMILFTAFIVAFSTTLKKTSLYILAGVIIIHLLNIVRIGLLGIAVYYYPEYAEFLHDIFFPLFIYGVVFVLWVVWVIKFSDDAKKIPAK